MRIVLREATHAEQAVEHAGAFVAINGAELGEADGQLTIAAQARLENQHVAGAVHRLELVFGFFDFDRAEHIFAIEIRVTAGLPEIDIHDVRRDDEIVAAREQPIAQPVLHLLADDRALRVPEDQAGAGFLLNAEEIELGAEAAMVAALRFFELVEILVELFLIDETRGVNSLHLRIAFVALPVGAGDVHQLERFYAAGGRDVRAAAEVDEFPGGVERDHRLDGFFLDQLAFEFLVRLAIEVERLGLGDQLALVGNVLRGDLVHPGFDFFEVFRRERLVAEEFVEKSGFDRRADAEFYVGIELEDGRGEQMRGGVAQHLDGVGILRGEDRKLYIVVERARKIDQLAIGARDESFLGETRRNLLRDFGGGCSAGDFARGAVRQRNLKCGHFSFLGLRLLPGAASIGEPRFRCRTYGARILHFYILPALTGWANLCRASRALNPARTGRRALPPFP